MTAAIAVGTHESAADSQRDTDLAKSRAEVRAQVDVWRQVGLDRHDIEGGDFTSRDYQRRLAE